MACSGSLQISQSVMAVPGKTMPKNQITPNFLPGVTLTLSSALFGGRYLGSHLGSEIIDLFLNAFAHHIQGE